MHFTPRHIAALLVSAMVALAYFWPVIGGSLQVWFGSTPIPVTMAELEKQFDSQPDAAIAKYRSSRVLATGKVASVDPYHATFESIYILNVHADFYRSAASLQVGQTATIECNKVSWSDHLVGLKPSLSECRVAS